jgi:hypothetical protein
VIQNWRIWHVITVILGWALGWGLLIPMGRWGWNFLVQNNFNFILSSLSIAVAIKWADRRFSWLKTILIFICWAAIWKLGTMKADLIVVAFDTDYAWCVIEAATALFGLLVTFVIYEYGSKRWIWLTALSIFGFAAGNLVVSGLFIMLPNGPQIAYPICLMIWGIIGGAIIALPTRDWKKILVTGGLWGLGLLVGYIAFLVFIPSYTADIWPERYGILRNIFVGAGLGLALILPSRRISGIGVSVILGLFVFVITGIFYLDNAVLLYGEMWGTIIRGGAIGLVMGLGYAYLTKENKSQQS